MSVSGGIKFFRKNYGDIDNASCLVSVSSGTATRNNARDRRTYTKWSSVDSDDSTTETFEYDFGASYAVDRIILVRNNFKAFTVKYWDGSAWAHFSSVVTKEGSQSNITETVNTKSTNYYEVASVSTQKIQVEITTTQTVDAEKEMYELIATEELGTFESYPVYEQSFELNQAKKETIGGKCKYSILDEKFSCTLGFEAYGNPADHALIQSIWQEREEFLIYPCGGNEAQFRYARQGNRLQDIYLVWFDGTFAPNHLRNVYVLPLSYSVTLVEVA